MFGKASNSDKGLKKSKTQIPRFPVRERLLPGDEIEGEVQAGCATGRLQGLPV